MAGERLTSTWRRPPQCPAFAAPLPRPRGLTTPVTSDTPFQQLLRALVRFWWVALLGIVLAGLAFVFATYKVSLGVPPTLTSRTQPSYSASTQLLITSKRDPYLSAANVNARIVHYPSATTTETTATTNGASQQLYTYDSSGGADGDLQRLVEIANDLPPRVTSDPVIALRNKLFRRIDGSVSAVNPYAFSGAGGFREGPLPYIQINGTAGSPQDALDITNQTAVAFKKWFVRQQTVSGVASADRVLVEQVNSADHAFAGSSKKPILGLAAALLVLIGAGGFALALDRLIPRRARGGRRAAVPAAPERAPLPAEGERVLERPLPVADSRLPKLETMTFETQLEDAELSGEKQKPAPRPRKGSNGAPRRRRTGTSAPRVAPNTDDAG
jgi:hypothetical protein